FRPDAVVNILAPGWKEEIEKLSGVSGQEILKLRDYISAIENRREYFRSLGATATDHGVFSPYTASLDETEAEALFQRALAGEADEADAKHFTGHMLMEFARMSVEDGLVMQLHPGSWRDHNTSLFNAFGADMGCDIPVATDYTRNLQPLLARYGDQANLTLVLFTLDESTCSRELAPLAGHYPCLRLGPPWWFQDSREGMTRFRERVTETCGIYNTAGFNDDTRAFPSIPARHDVARRIDANFLARLVAEHVLEEGEAAEMLSELSYSLAKSTYRL
ncbi:MAG: glucuronate isomerase, partial [Planctomycetota bacterium]|nr:glucuronate isomerase [Planctomycetota bacterium]